MTTKLLRFIILVYSVLGMSATTLAQEFKSTIRLVVPYGAGGSTDILARAVAPALSKELGQTVIIENKPGANGQIGTLFVKNAPPDGSVFLFTLDHSVVIVPLITPNVPYAPLTDFVTVAKAGRFEWIMATPVSVPAKTMPEFIELARKDPGLRNYGVPVVGGVPQVMGEALAKKVGEPFTVIPFGGAATLMPQVMGGQLAAGIVGTGEALNMAKSNRVRLMGISGTKRSAMLPDVPTFEELGMPGVTLGTLYTVFAPKGLAQPLSEKFNKALSVAIQDPSVIKSAQEMSITLESSSLNDIQHEIVEVANFWKNALKAPQ